VNGQPALPARSGAAGAPSTVLALACAVVAVTVIDLSVVNVALPSIQADLDVHPADLQWVVVAYGVLFAGCLLLGGRVGDRFGHGKVLAAGLGVLTLASLAGGFASSLSVLVGARAGQGLGAALAAPNALAVLTRAFADGPPRARAIGMIGASAGTAAVAGSVLGGLLVQVAGWQSVFLVNVPIGALLGVLVLTRIPSAPGSAADGHPDLPAALLLTAGLMATVLGAHQSTNNGWSSPRTLLPLALGPILLAAFIVRERCASSPLLPLAVLRQRSLVAASTSGALVSASFLAFIYHATLFVQQGQDYSPLAAGASTIPIAVLCLFASLRAAPRLIGRVGAAWTIAAGSAVQAAGLALLARTPDTVDYALHLLPAYCLIGTGLALAQVAVQVAALARAQPEVAGVVGGALETARELGGALGIAVVASAVAAGAADPAADFRHAVVGAAVLAAAGTAVALAALRPTEATDRTPAPLGKPSAD